MDEHEVLIGGLDYVEAWLTNTNLPEAPERLLLEQGSTGNARLDVLVNGRTAGSRTLHLQLGQAVYRALDASSAAQEHRAAFHVVRDGATRALRLIDDELARGIAA